MGGRLSRGPSASEGTVGYNDGDEPMPREEMSGAKKMPIRVHPLGREEEGSDLAHLSAGERMELMWQLAVDAWTMKGEPERAESRLQRDVVRVQRGRG